MTESDALLDDPPRRPSVPPWIHLLVAVAGILAVVFGLRFGARPMVRAAIVYGAPAARAGSLAWPVVALEEADGTRSALAGVDVTVSARAGADSAEWRGATNDDGVAEALLVFPTSPSSSPIAVEVRSHGDVLASGRAAGSPAGQRAATTPATPWMPYSQKNGPIALDVAVPSGRAAPGFPTAVWVRATEAGGPSRGAPVAGAAVEAERDSSLTRALALAPTDAEGWAELDVVPVGLAVSLRLTARDSTRRSGEWVGGLTMAPGAAHVASRDRFSPDEAPAFDVTWPTARTAGYLEIDDTTGRAWATTSLAARLTAPPLPAGFYWAVASGAPDGSAFLSAATIARPFAVAASDDAALAFGADRDACRASGDPRLPSRRLATCLAVTPIVPAPRWIALDGFVQAHARDAARRGHGLAIAVGAVLTAMALETALLLRAALTPPAGGAGARSAWAVAVGVLVAVLGFLLLAAFLLRAA